MVAIVLVELMIAKAVIGLFAALVLFVLGLGKRKRLLEAVRILMEKGENIVTARVCLLSQAVK